MAARWGGWHMRPSGLLFYRSQERLPAPPLGARRAGRRRSRHAGIGGGSDHGTRWSALLPLLSPLDSHARSHGSKVGPQHRTRHGTPVRRALLVARPRPWRAWVRPAGSRAHQHLQQITHGTKAGSQQSFSCPRGGSPRGATRRKGRTCSPGWRRDARSAWCSTARRGVFPSPSCRFSPNPNLAKALGQRGLG
jgi:hypothetical protein